MPSGNGVALKVGDMVRFKNILLMNFPVCEADLMGSGSSYEWHESEEDGEPYFTDLHENGEPICCTALYLARLLSTLQSIAGESLNVTVTDLVPAAHGAADFSHSAASHRVSPGSTNPPGSDQSSQAGGFVRVASKTRPSRKTAMLAARIGRSG